MRLPYNTDFTPDKSVKSVSFWPVTDADDLSIILPPWHATEALLKQRARHENKLGRSVLYFMFDDNILSSNIERTLDSFEIVAEAIAQEVSARPHRSVRWIASSMGTTTLMYTLGTKKLPADELDLIAPGGDLARCLWDGLRTQPLRRQFEAQGLSIRELVKAWEILAPTYQAAHVEGTNTTISVSRADEIIRPETAFEFAEAMTQTNQVNLRVNDHLGHYGTIMRHMLFAG